MFVVLPMQINALYTGIIIIACSGCDEGLMLCDGRLGICCTYYFEDGCVEECPEESHVVDKDFNCVERT